MVMRGSKESVLKPTTWILLLIAVKKPVEKDETTLARASARIIKKNLFSDLIKRFIGIGIISL